jgi:hypothetical protein
VGERLICFIGRASVPAIDEDLRRAFIAFVVIPHERTAVRKLFKSSQNPDADPQIRDNSVFMLKSTIWGFFNFDMRRRATILKSLTMFRET